MVSSERLPRLGGIVPLSWLNDNNLQHQNRSGGDQHAEHARHAQLFQSGEPAKAWRDAACKLVMTELPARKILRTRASKTRHGRTKQTVP